MITTKIIVVVGIKQTSTIINIGLGSTTTEECQRAYFRGETYVPDIYSYLVESSRSGCFCVKAKSPCVREEKFLGKQGSMHMAAAVQLEGTSERMMINWGCTCPRKNLCSATTCHGLARTMIAFG